MHTEDFHLTTSTVILDSGYGGVISLGASASTQNLSTYNGIFLSGSGEFAAGINSGEHISFIDNTVSITGNINATAGNISESIVQLVLDSASFSVSVGNNSSSISQLILDSASFSAIVTDQSSSISAIEIHTGSINLSVAALQDLSGSISSSIVSMINLDQSGVQIHGNYLELSSSKF